jgi:hypothetical protein
MEDMEDRKVLVLDRPVARHERIIQEIPRIAQRDVTLLWKTCGGDRIERDEEE